MYWNTKGLVTDDQGDQYLYIDYETCRDIVAVFDEGMMTNEQILHNWNLTCAQLNFIIDGYIEGEFSL